MEWENCAPGRIEVDLDEDGFLSAEDERLPLVPVSFQRERIHRIVWRPEGGDRAHGNEREALVLGGKEAVPVDRRIERE
jgi:hypothetical protein